MELAKKMEKTQEQHTLLGDFLGIIKEFFQHPILTFYKYGAKVLVHLVYRVEFRGFENIPKKGPAILICNHVSYVDGLLIHTACKRNVRFVIDQDIYGLPFVHYFMRLGGAIPISPNKHSVTQALQEVSQAMKEGDLICIFPEGSLTYTGNMTRFRFGVEWMVKNDGISVVPMALGGLWGSIFSRKYRNSKIRWFPRSLFRKIVAVCGKPIPPEKATINYMQRVVMELKNSTGLL